MPNAYSGVVKNGMITITGWNGFTWNPFGKFEHGMSYYMVSNVLMERMGTKRLFG